MKSARTYRGLTGLFSHHLILLEFTIYRERTIKNHVIHVQEVFSLTRHTSVYCHFCANRNCTTCVEYTQKLCKYKHTIGLLTDKLHFNILVLVKNESTSRYRKRIIRQCSSFLIFK